MIFTIDNLGDYNNQEEYKLRTSILEEYNIPYTTYIHAQDVNKWYISIESDNALIMVRHEELAEKDAYKLLKPLYERGEKESLIGYIGNDVLKEVRGAPEVTVFHYASSRELKKLSADSFAKIYVLNSNIAVSTSKYVRQFLDDETVLFQGAKMKAIEFEVELNKIFIKRKSSWDKLGSTPYVYDGKVFGISNINIIK